MAETLEAQLKKYGPSQLPFEEWKKAANEIRFFGQTKEDIFDILGYPVNPDDTPIKVTYKGDKGGYDRRTGDRSKQAVVRSDKASVQTVGEDVYNKGVVAPKGSGLQEHHRRVMDVYAPFFEGLNPKEQKELAEWFVTEGAPLGNVKENLTALTPADHDALHKYLKDNYLQSKTGTPLINLKNLSLNERFVPALTFLEQIQPAIDDATVLAANRGSIRFAKGRFARGLTRTLLPSAGGAALSIALGSEDLQAREQLAEQDPSFLNVLQRDLARTEMAADIAGAVPSPATPTAEITGLAAGGGNLIIDVARDPIGALKAVNFGIRTAFDEFITGIGDAEVWEDIQEGMTRIP